jgi:hypothetical protein
MAAFPKALEGRKITPPDFMGLMAAERAGPAPSIRIAGNASRPESRDVRETGERFRSRQRLIPGRLLADGRGI